MGHFDNMRHPLRKSPQPDSGTEPKPARIAFIYKSEMDYISRCILDRPDIETGGQLFGFLTEYGAPVVCYAIGPGPRANHQTAFFNQDVEYLKNTYDAINRKYGLRYIGEWHSHHRMGLAKPSGHDASTVVTGMVSNNFRHFLLCIGNCDRDMRSTLNAFTFQSDALRYHHAPWRIIGMDSPYRNMIDLDLGNLLCHPITQHPCHGSNFILDGTCSAAMKIPDYDDGYWLNSKANNKALKEIIDYLTGLDGGKTTVKPMLDEDKLVHLFIQDEERLTEVFFDSRFPAEPPMIFFPEDAQVNDSARWRYDGYVFDSFVRYYNDFFHTVNTTNPEK